MLSFLEAGVNNSSNRTYVLEASGPSLSAAEPEIMQPVFICRHPGAVLK